MNTLAALSSLPDSQLRVLLAEALGWTDFADHFDDGTKTGIPPGMNRGYTQEPPNYPGSLDACHVVEMGLTPELVHHYNKVLKFMFESVPWHDDSAAKNYGWHASARQRTIALIATLQA